MTDHQREEKKDKHKESRKIGFLVDINLGSDGLVACQLLHSPMILCLTCMKRST